LDIVRYIKDKERRLKLNYRWLFALLFIVAGVILAVGTVTLFMFMQQKSSSEFYKHDFKRVVDIKDYYLNSKLKTAEDIINSVSTNRYITTYIKDFSSSYDEVVAIFETIVKSKEEINQLRILDANGIERVRVDRNRVGLEPFNVTHLQDKSDRYYFVEAMKLKDGEIFYSQIDLNIENGKVEYPLNATYRVAKPIYIDNKIAGVVVINLFMNEILQNIVDIVDFNTYLCDKDGYLVVSNDNRYSNWNRYFSNKSFISKEFDEHEKQILKDDFHYESLFFSHHIKLENGDNFIIVANPKHRFLDLIESNILKTISIISLIMLPIAFIFAYFLATLFEKLKLKEEQIESKNIEYDTLLSLLDEGIYVLDREKKITFINKKCEEILGYSFAELEGKMPHNTFRYSESSECPFYNVILSGISYHSSSEKFITKDKRIINVRVSSVPLIKHNKIYASVSSFYDITKFIQEEEENKRREQILIQQSKMASMGEMISNIAHQWRQPLNTLSLTLFNMLYEFEEKKMSDESMNDYYQQSKLLIDNMSKTIDDFRNFFKPHKEQMLFCVKNVINEALNIVSASMQENLIKIEKELAEELFVFGYPNELAHVIVNILDNAKDQLIEKKVTDACVKISSFEQNKIAMIEIYDNGGGVSESIKNRIFEPYFTTKDRQKGTGIGLYMSKMIVENMGGILSIINRDGGAVFTISLPISSV